MKTAPRRPREAPDEATRKVVEIMSLMHPGIRQLTANMVARFYAQCPVPWMSREDANALNLEETGEAQLRFIPAASNGKGGVSA